MTNLELETAIGELRNQLDKISEFMNSLTAGTTLPKEVGDAIISRLTIPIPPVLSIVSASTKTQAVNESGSASYNVAKPMTGFVTVQDASGNSYLIPYY